MFLKTPASCGGFVCYTFYMKYLLFLIPLLFLSPIHAQALSCVNDEENIWFATYEEGEYLAGFSVSQKLTGNWCDTKPVVGELADSAVEIFDQLFLNTGLESPHGSFSVQAKCVTENVLEECFPVEALETLSGDSDRYYYEKLLWQNKVQNASRITATHKWFSFGFIIVSLFLVMVWPWLLVMWRPQLRARLTTLLVIVLPIQLIFILSMPMFDWSYPVVSTASGLAAKILSFALGVEVLYIIMKFLRRNKDTVFPNKE